MASSSESDDEYKMTHDDRGHAVIINNENFSDGNIKRTGTDVDASAIYEMLEGIGFQKKNIENRKDVPTNEMEELIKEAVSKDYSNSDCFVCVILSHGDTGTILGSDGEMISISHLVGQIKRNQHSSLKTKPKIFIIQACRGLEFDLGVIMPGSIRADNKDEKSGPKKLEPKKEDTPEQLSVPSEPHFLFAYSSTPGQISWRHGGGSWFIGSLTKVINQYWQQHDLVSMTTEAMRRVAENCRSGISENITQMPSQNIMLTKKLFFRSRAN